MSKIPNRFDVRVVQRNIKKGAVSESEYQEHLQKLPDALEKGITIGTNDELDPEDFLADDK